MMKKFLPILMLAGCTYLPTECNSQIDAVEQKCRNVGTQGSLEPELKAAKECIGGKVEAVCVQHNVAEPRQVEWTYNK